MVTGGSTLLRSSVLTCWARLERQTDRLLLQHLCLLGVMKLLSNAFRHS